MKCENCRKGLTERILLCYCSQEKYTEMYFRSNIYYDYSFIWGTGCQTWLSFQNSYVLLFLKTMLWPSSSEALGLVCVPGPLALLAAVSAQADALCGRPRGAGSCYHWRLNEEPHPSGWGLVAYEAACTVTWSNQNHREGRGGCPGIDFDQ